MTTRVLVAYASKMGSTAEIAEAIAAELRTAGALVTLSATDRAMSPVEYDAVVVGSAVYAGRWMRSAWRYLRRNRRALATRPTWLFQSGPCGPGDQTPRTAPTPKVVALARELGIGGPVVFGGNLDPSRAHGRIARWVANSDAAGDYRDWDAIRAWADQIAASLAAKVG